MAKTERVVYGAFDDPGVSIFATDAQEPIPNILTYFKPVPRKACDEDLDACPLRRQFSRADRFLFRRVKSQVDEVAAERNKSILSQQRQRQEQMDRDITMGLAAELDRQRVAASRCLQIHNNVHSMRNLKVEVERAQTALYIKDKIMATTIQTAEDKQRERAVALAEQRATEKECLEEIRLRAQKRRAYGADLISQMTELRSKRLRDQREAIAEGQRELRECQEKVQQDLDKEAMNKEHQRQVLLKAQEQSEDMMRATREANAASQSRHPERGILDALGPMTATFVSAAEKRRQAAMKGRESTAARLGFQIYQINHDLEARDEQITNLGVAELEAKEYVLAMELARNKLPRKREIRDQLLSHREEQKFFRDKALKEGLVRPHDPTCFGEREYRIQTKREEGVQRLGGRFCKDIEQMQLENKERRAAAIEEQRRIIQAIYDHQDQEDAFVASERMKLLAAQSPEVLRAINPTSLTEEELNAFNLKK